MAETGQTRITWFGGNPTTYNNNSARILKGRDVTVLRPEGGVEHRMYDDGTMTRVDNRTGESTPVSTEHDAYWRNAFEQAQTNAQPNLIQRGVHWVGRGIEKAGNWLQRFENGGTAQQPESNKQKRMKELLLIINGAAKELSTKQPGDNVAYLAQVIQDPQEAELIDAIIAEIPDAQEVIDQVSQLSSQMFKCGGKTKKKVKKGAKGCVPCKKLMKVGGKLINVWTDCEGNIISKHQVGGWIRKGYEGLKIGDTPIGGFSADHLLTLDQIKAQQRHKQGGWLTTFQDGGHMDYETKSNISGTTWEQRIDRDNTGALYRYNPGRTSHVVTLQTTGLPIINPNRFVKYGEERYYLTDPKTGRVVKIEGPTIDQRVEEEVPIVNSSIIEDHITPEQDIFIFPGGFTKVIPTPVQKEVPKKSKKPSKPEKKVEAPKQDVPTQPNDNTSTSGSKTPGSVRQGTYPIYESVPASEGHNQSNEWVEERDQVNGQVRVTWRNKKTGEISRIKPFKYGGWLTKFN